MNATETDVLDETILDDEPGCQFRHTWTACSTEVTHALTSCQHPVMVCANAAELKERTRLTSVCSTCGNPARVCWRVVPI